MSQGGWEGGREGEEVEEGKRRRRGREKEEGKIEKGGNVQLAKNMLPILNGLHSPHTCQVLAEHVTDIPSYSDITQATRVCQQLS
jgi:hypothetical protein